MARKNIYLGTLVAALSYGAYSPAMALPEGFTVGVDFGRTEARNACRNITNCSDADTGPKVELGYSFSENFGVELGYTSFGTLVDSGDSTARISQDARAITASALGSIPLNEWFSLYGRAGLGWYKTDGSGTIQGLPVDDNDGTTPYFGIGGKFTFSDRFALRVEFQRFTNISSNIGGSDDDVQALFGGVVFRL